MAQEWAMNRRRFFGALAALGIGQQFLQLPSWARTRDSVPIVGDTSTVTVSCGPTQPDGTWWTYMNGSEEKNTTHCAHWEYRDGLVINLKQFWVKKC